MQGLRRRSPDYAHHVRRLRARNKTQTTRTHTPSFSTDKLNICRSEKSAQNDELPLTNSEHVSTKNDNIHKHSQYQRGKPRFQNNTSPKATSVAAIVGKCVTNHVTNAQPIKANAPLAKNWDIGQHAVVKNNESIQHIEHPR